MVDKIVENEKEGKSESMIKKAAVFLCALCLLLVCSFSTAESVSVPVIDNMKVFEIPDNEALRFVRELKTGWNLGNTFDAFDVRNWYRGDELGMESAWVKTITTREDIHALKEAGFNLIRIPCTWKEHVDKNDVISAVWLNRVKEVASWVLEEGMYAIVNVHHDDRYVENFYLDKAHYDRTAAYMSSIWRQLAEAFADTDEHLILESMNEPRLFGTQWEWSWDSKNAQCQEAMECINQLNQLFVDTVRAAGGHNATRYLAVPSYCANPWNAVSDQFVLPTDSIENHIIVAAHAYTPYNFALNLNSTDRTFSLDDGPKKAEIAGFLKALYEKYVQHGIPVLMDEYGALNKGGNLQDRVNFTAYYVASASARGITCCWWDNHNFTGDGEQFGILDRKQAAFTYPEIVEAIMKNCLIGRE